jgi:sugar lactone lactonase YvrE
VYRPEDVISLLDSKKYVSRYGYDNVFNALASSGTEEGFDVSRDGRYVYVAVRGTRTTAAIFQYECSKPWDLSTITYSGKSLIVGDYEPSCNSVTINDDGTTLYFSGYGNDTVWQCELSTPYDLATAIPLVEKAYVGNQDSAPYSPCFSTDGTKMYVMGTTNDTVYQYTLSTAWNPNTATYANKSLSVTSIDTTPYGLFFKGDGTKLYITGATWDIVVSFTLSTAWDIATATSDYVQKSASVNAQSTVSYEVDFSSDGTKMYVLNGLSAATDTVFQYTLSTAWDVSTATYANKSFSVNAQETTATGMRFKSDGTKMYIIGQTNRTVYPYSLSTAWDISTAVYDNNWGPGGMTNPTGLFFGNNGTKLYVIETSSDTIWEYNLGVAWNVTTQVSFVRVSSTITDATPNSLFFSSDGTKLTVLGNSGAVLLYYTLSTAWDVSTMSLSGSFRVDHLGTPVTGLAYKTDGTEIYVLSQASGNNRVYQMPLNTAWNPLTIKGRYGVRSQVADPRAIFFKPDGTAMYITGPSAAVHEYSLSSAWEITSASYVRASPSLGEGTPTGLWFDNNSYDVYPPTDGTKMYIIGQANDSVREFNLSIPWNVSTASFVRSVSVGFETAPSGIAFAHSSSSWGNAKFFIVGVTNKCVYGFKLFTGGAIRYSLGVCYIGTNQTVPRGLSFRDNQLFISSPNVIQKFDVGAAFISAETLTLSQSFATTGIYGMDFSSDGLLIHGAVDANAGNGGRQVRQIRLTSPYDLTTASLSSTEFIPLYGLVGATSSPWGVRVSPDGTRMFVLADVIQGLHQFSLRFA